MISIVTVVKNDKHHIGRTMHSVLSQKYLEIEYIVKDGLSIDGTSEIVEKVIEQYPKRKIEYVNIKDEGIYDAMNQAVLHCHGDWIIFMNSGDTFYTEEILEKIFEKDSRYEVYGILYGDVVVCNEAGKAIWRADIDLIKKRMPFCHQSCFIRRELLLRFPFNTTYTIAADYNNILDLYFYGESFFYYGQIMAYFDLTGISSKKFVKRYKEKVKVLKQHGLYKSSKCIYIFGVCLEYIKTIMDCIIPDIFKQQLKKWYMFHIKKYKRMSKLRK